MRAILKSESPKSCELIVNGEKTVLLSKTRPKIETPFKGYIYCKKGNVSLVYSKDTEDVAWCKPYVDWTTYGGSLRKCCAYRSVNGKVIGEYVCNIIFMLFNTDGNPPNYMTEILPDILARTALSYREFQYYVASRADKNNIYGLHISDLKIYDKPKELGEFRRDECTPAPCGHTTCNPTYCGSWSDCQARYLTRPPASWCYVEEL